MKLPPSARLHRAARAYAARLGWHVFPCRRRGKEPITTNGYLDATTDAEQIDRWWRRHPDANIGIRCDASGLVALDVDPRHGGDAELRALEAEHGTLPDTVVQLTGGGGLHYLFAAPEGLRWRAEIAPGLETKSAGYIIAAPSQHPDGPLYHWEHSARPLEVALASPPSWMIRLGTTRHREMMPATGPAAESLIARAFVAAGYTVSRIDDGRVAVPCPWADEHSTESPASSTAVLAPTERYPDGFFRCLHAHCASRGPREALNALPAEAVRAAGAAVAESRSNAA